VKSFWRRWHTKENWGWMAAWYGGAATSTFIGERGLAEGLTFVGLGVAALAAGAFWAKR
jgi:uncharacterized protein (DUF58 family)